jgi:SAM-dependent methyltransferase
MPATRTCSLCAAQSRPILRGRPDTEYNVACRLDYWNCKGCGLVFADPVPSELIPSFYVAYSTHADVSAHTHGRFWRVMDAVTPRLDRNDAFDTLGLAADAHILDFGCGAGQFLQGLADAGYTRLSGCDFDPKVAAATMPGIDFYAGLDALGDAQFDAITLNHVIEHLEDVPGSLARLKRHLAPGGFIYIRTPNARSVLRRLFGAAWRGWETPRHLNVLTFEAIRLAANAAGASIDRLSSSNDMRIGMIVGSMGNAVPFRPVRRALLPLLYPVLAWTLFVAKRIRPESGEEIVAVLR